jgi:hypothetical protein
MTPNVVTPPGTGEVVGPNTGMGTFPGLTPDLGSTAPGATGLPPAAASAIAGDDGRQFAGGTNLGVGAYASYNENMMGDLIGARSLRIQYRAQLRAVFPILTGTTLGDGTPALTVAPNPRGVLTFTDSTSPNVRTVNVSDFAGTNNLNYVQALGPNSQVDTFFAKQALQTLVSTGNLTADQIAQFNRLTPDQRRQILANRGKINDGLTRALKGLTIPNVTVESVTGSFDSTIIYQANLLSETVVALPGASSVVGRVKMSEDNSPLPRDRFIFNYDSFGDVPFTPAGITVNRFQFGVEKTFRDGLWSFEFRLPFAGTLASTYTQGFEMTDVELGNVRLALKRLWTRNDVLNIATGLGLSLPTARDQVVLSQLGSELFRFQNDSVQLEPYIAALFTPNERLFGQLWTGVNFDASGGRLTWDPNVFGGNGSSRIWDLPILTIDGQIGYWLIKNRCGTIRGLAPFLELHYNRVLAQDVLIDGVNDRANAQGLRITGIGNQELNMTAGVICQIGNNLNLTIGGSAPLFQAPDRTFNGQFGIRMNYLFGRTARAQNAMYQVGGF